MKITKLIGVFEKLLPIYKEGYKKNYGYRDMKDNDIWYGLCSASLENLGIDISEVMCFNGYYKYFMSYGSYLFKPPSCGRDLKPRIDFMESEIKDLKRLLKKGYTHV